MQSRPESPAESATAFSPLLPPERRACFRVSALKTAKSPAELRTYPQEPMSLSTETALEEFSPEERARASAYHRPLYLALLFDVALGAGVLAALAWSPLGDQLFAPLRPLPPVAAAAAYAALVTAFSSVVRTPMALWRGWWRERRWGFSTQGPGG